MIPDIAIFADGANKADMLAMYAKPYISGFTTNPTLMRQAGISDYEAFARDIIEAIPDRPLSFEVFADDMKEMGRQARLIASWGPNIYVKIPITNTRGESTEHLCRGLSGAGIKLNITAVFTIEQVAKALGALARHTNAFISIFAGRIADTGHDPVPLMRAALAATQYSPNAKVIWASPREVLNIFQAAAIGCDIITATSDILKKLPLIDKDLTGFSLETVRMFYDDGQTAGYKL